MKTCHIPLVTKDNISVDISCSTISSWHRLDSNICNYTKRSNNIPKITHFQPPFLTIRFVHLTKKLIGVNPSLEQVVLWLTQKLHQILHLEIKHTQVKIMAVFEDFICLISLTYFLISTFEREEVSRSEDKQEDTAHCPHINSLRDG